MQSSVQSWDRGQKEANEPKQTLYFNKIKICPKVGHALADLDYISFAIRIDRASIKSSKNIYMLDEVLYLFAPRGGTVY